MTHQEVQKPEAALVKLSADLGATFEEAMASIGAVRSSAGEFVSSVDLLQTLGSSDDSGTPDDSASFSTFSERAERAATAAESAAAELNEKAFQSGLQSLALILAELKRHTIELASISSLTKIAKTENPTVADRLSTFTQTLDKRFRDLRSSASEAAVLIDAIRSESTDARAALAAIALELRRISRDAGNDAVRLERLKEAHLEQMDRMVADSRDLSGEVQSSVARVIACLQFPDAFAQRMEHVRTMLAALEEPRSAAERKMISNIAAAQLEAMGIDLAEATEKAISALDGIPELGNDTAVGRRGRAGPDASSVWIEAEARANQVMIETVAASRNRLDGAVALIGRIVSKVDTARALLEDSRRQNHELNISVQNASIVASRFSSGTSALHVLAEGVKRVVGQVSQGVAKIFSELIRIRSASEALERTPLASELDALGRIQELAAHRANEDTVKLARAREARQQLVQSAERLSNAAADGRSRFGLARQYPETLFAISEEMADSFAEVETSATACDLAWIEALYTMNEERAVHERAVGALGPESRAPSAVAKTASAELDDFLL